MIGRELHGHSSYPFLSALAWEQKRHHGRVGNQKALWCGYIIALTYNNLRSVLCSKESPLAVPPDWFVISFASLEILTECTVSISFLLPPLPFRWMQLTICQSGAGHCSQFCSQIWYHTSGVALCCSFWFGPAVWFGMIDDVQWI